MLRTFICFLTFFGWVLVGYADIWVSPGGDDARAGTKAAPFATLARAQKAVRELRAKGLPEKGMTVWLEKGEYVLTAPLEFGADDGGTPGAPVVWQAVASGEVWLTGSATVAADQFGKATDPAVLKRLPEMSRNKVVTFSLPALGIEDWVRELPSAFGGYKLPPPFVGVYCDGERMPWARWPNEGFATYDEIIDTGSGLRDRGTKRRPAVFSYTGDRPSRWDMQQGVWMFGYWARAYISSIVQAGVIDTKKREITTKVPLHYGLDTWGAKRWYAFNLPEELDRPGEWYLDRSKGLVYFWPPRSGDCRITVTRLSGPMVHCKNAENLIFRGLGVEGGRGDGILVEGGKDVRVVGCEIRNVSANAITLRNGTGHRVVGCDIHHVGAGGIHLQGGDRQTLSPANFEAVNNHIHHTSEIKRNYAPPLNLKGVGIRAAHNLIHHIPHIAVLYSGNDLTMEYNEIYWCLTETSEAGVFYCGRNWTYRNNVIQYNYIHHINDQVKGSPTGCNVAHLDDCVSGNTYRGNILFKVGRGISVCGGPWNVVENNLFIDCLLGVDLQTRGLHKWAFTRHPDGTVTGTAAYARMKGVSCPQLQRLKKVPWDREPYTKYPDMANLLRDDPIGAPRWCRITDNISINGPAMKIARDVEPEWATIERNWNGPDDGDPGVIAPYEGNFRLRPNAPALAKTRFKDIPIDKIGLLDDATRRSWPVKAEPPPKDWEPAWVLRREQEKKMPVGLPIVTVRGTTAKITIDGKVEGDEWRPGEEQTVAVNTVKPELLQWSATTGEKVRNPPVAWIQTDDQALYLAFETKVDPTKGIAGGRKWGASDAVELAVSVVSGGEPGPILLWRGYTDGHLETSAEAGAPKALAAATLRGVEYGAKVVNKGLWTAELRIPFAAIGVAPKQLNPTLLFALTVRRTRSDEWVTWKKETGHSWDVRRSGVLWLSPFGDLALPSLQPSRAYILVYGRSGKKPLMLKADKNCTVAEWSKPVGQCISVGSGDLAGDEWQTLSFSFVPEADGSVDMKLMGRGERRSDNTFIPVWTRYDNVRVEGAKITNGSFEEVDALGQPAGWKADISKPLLVNDSTGAADGAHFVKCWHNGRWKQTLEVKAGRRVTVTCQVRGSATPLR